MKKSARNKNSSKRRITKKQTPTRSVKATKKSTSARGRIGGWLAAYWKRRTLKKDKKSRAKAERLAQMPKSRLKRILWRLHPKRVIAFWFSKRGLVFGLKAFGITLLLGLVFLFGLFSYYRKDLPKNIADLQACIQGQTTQYYDSTGEVLLWSSKGDVECIPVKLENISPYLISAVLASEDKDFYEHSGYNLRGVIRAAVNNFTGGSTTQGGSTITQQYVKNAVLKQSERVYSRKIKELILSIELERTFSKDEILNAYLNVASFGGIYDGIEAASRGYFGKPSSELTLDEASLLVAAIPSPSFYWNNPEAHANRQRVVLNQMLDQQRITEEEYNQAIEVDTLANVLERKGQYEDIIAPHFVLEVEKQLREEFGENIRYLGLKVITSLDVDIQSTIEKAVDDHIGQVESLGLDNAASVVVDVETSRVLALLGSRDFEYPGFGQNNYANSGTLDPGSTYKAYVYTSLFENTNSWGPGSTMYDYETQFTPTWKPQNWDKRERGPLSIRQALGLSRNPPAIKAMYIAGVNETIKLASDLGVRTAPPCGDQCGLAAAIGGGVELRMDEHTNGYASLARLGKYKPLTYVDKIYDSEGSLIRAWQDTEGEQVIDPQSAYLTNHMLSDEGNRIIGNGYYTIPGATTAMKTGTTDLYTNNWIMGYTKKYSVSVWIGHHDRGRTFRNISTNRAKRDIYRDIMVEIHKEVPSNQKNAWQAPAGIKRVSIDRNSGYQSSSGVSDIFPAWYVPKSQDLTDEVEIDTVSGKKATECTPARAIDVVRGGNILSEIPETDPQYSIWMKPILAKLGEVVGGEVPSEDDDIHNCDDVKPNIVFTSLPSNCDGSCSVTVDVNKGTHSLGTVNFILDGQILPGGSFTVSNNDSISYTITPDFDGSQTLVVEVIDDALYDSQVSANISFTKATPLALEQPIVAGNNANFGWNQEKNNLILYFTQACSGEDPIALPSASQSYVVDISSFPSGTCGAYISDSITSSNTVTFEL